MAIRGAKLSTATLTARCDKYAEEILINIMKRTRPNGTTTAELANKLREIIEKEVNRP